MNISVTDTFGEHQCKKCLNTRTIEIGDHWCNRNNRRTWVEQIKLNNIGAEKYFIEQEILVQQVLLMNIPWNFKTFAPRCQH